MEGANLVADKAGRLGWMKCCRVVTPTLARHSKASNRLQEWIGGGSDLVAVVPVVDHLEEEGAVEAGAARSRALAEGSRREVGMPVEEELVRLSLTNWGRLHGGEGPVLARHPHSQKPPDRRVGRRGGDLQKKGGPPAYRSAVGAGRQDGIHSSGDVSDSHGLVAALAVEPLSHHREVHNLEGAWRTLDEVVDSWGRAWEGPAVDHARRRWLAVRAGDRSVDLHAVPCRLHEDEDRQCAPGRRLAPVRRPV